MENIITIINLFMGYIIVAFIASAVDIICIITNFLFNMGDNTNNKYIFGTVQNLREKTSWHIVPCVIIFVLIGLITPINFIAKLIYMLINFIVKKIKG